MKKEKFIELGVDEELAKKLETASNEELKGFIPKDRFNEVNEEKKRFETSLAERDTQLETLKKSTGDIEQLKEQITTLQAENATKDETHKAEIHSLKVEAALESALVSSNAINTKAIKPFLKDLDKAEFNDDGTIKGLSDQIKGLLKSEETSFLFKTETKPKPKGWKPGQGEDPDNSENPQGVDLSKMSYNELTKYMAENPDVKLD